MRKSELNKRLIERCSDLSLSRYFTSFVSLMSHKYKEVFSASAEVLGMALAYMKEKKDVS